MKKNTQKAICPWNPLFTINCLNFIFIQQFLQNSLFWIISLVFLLARLNGLLIRQLA